MIRLKLPAPLVRLAKIDDTVVLLDVDGPVTLRTALDALESRLPMLRGTIRDPVSGRRRAYIRIFACGEDLSEQPPDEPLPDAVASGAEPLLVVGALAGG